MFDPKAINGLQPYPFIHLHPAIDLKFPPELNQPKQLVFQSWPTPTAAPATAAPAAAAASSSYQ